MNYFLIILTVVLVACHKDDPPTEPSSVEEYTNGLVILNEGLFQQNNSSLCFYSFEDGQVYTQSFFSENERGLGDTANDFEKYTLDGVEYIIIAVDISSQLEIVEANTLKSVAQIPLLDGETPKEPRRIEIFGYAAFVCNFDGTVTVIDLITHEVIKTIQVGANPDGMVQVGNELFISNSGGLNFPVYDSTVSVIDMTTREVINTIQTKINCTTMIVDSQNEIYLLSIGNYTNIDPTLIKLDAVSKQVVAEFSLPTNSMVQVHDWIYYHDASSETIKRFDMSTDIDEGIAIIDVGGFVNFSGLEFVPELNLIYCFDANGYVNSSIIKAYNTSGVFQYQFTAELNAKRIIYNE